MSDVSVCNAGCSSIDGCSCAPGPKPEKSPLGHWGYRGWTISQEPDGYWHAFSDNYDASYEGPEDGWVDNGEKVVGVTLSDACDEIDAWIDERVQDAIAKAMMTERSKAE